MLRVATEPELMDNWDTHQVTSYPAEKPAVLGIVYDTEKETKKVKNFLRKSRPETKFNCVSCLNKGALDMEFILDMQPDFLVIDIDETGDNWHAMGLIIRNYLERDIPIIYTSNNPQDFLKFATLHRVNSFFVGKPYNSEMLSRVMNKIFL